ncbi:hypothetical protein KSF_066620 [Reticulibacter mediterranei]|uniref:Serine/threonine protein kinase n=1 Tax=Reticulibacter mediterranei TaxID=2778369 RepID=A0A8J3IJD0_9CHLR|nr:NERD domain-containing protein kinase family protein [Reticulibacter mediterranei]GHO96614.1 hypothetical protein KSF_066620 [Reticulibacter mediterranei]
MNTKDNNEWARHVTFCAGSRISYALYNNGERRGSQAELDTVQFLLNNLKPHDVGDYRILVNYNIPMQGADAREVDIVLINKYGVFLLEVKSWIGSIQAYDDAWIVDDRYRRENALESINAKARILYSRTFGEGGELSELKRVSVAGIVVLTEGTGRFVNKGTRSGLAVMGLNDALYHAVTSTQLLHRGPSSRMLDNLDIRRVKEAIFVRHTTREVKLIGNNYRILKELSFGDLFDAYEAENVDMPDQHVRLKRYQLPKLTLDENMVRALKQFRRSGLTLSALGSHTNILGTKAFFPDQERPDVYYEVTELVPGKGRRLDEIMSNATRPFSLDEQFNYLEQLCMALERAHGYKTAEGRPKPIFHRNICPETIFVTNEQVVKLADFDFAKFGMNPQDSLTYSDPDIGSSREATEAFIETPYTAPEVLEFPSSASPASDIYALGVLWYQLASVKTHNPKFDRKQADKQINSIRRLPEAARSLMKRMVAEVPMNRPQHVEEVLVELRLLKNTKQQAE